MSISLGKNRVTLLPQSPSNLAPLALRLLKPKVLKYLPDHWSPVTDLTSAEHWLEAQQADCLRILADHNTAGLLIIHKTPEQWNLGFLLLPEYWGQGIATDMVQQVQRQATQTTPPPTLAGGADHNNVASLRVLEKCGFVFHEEDTHVLAIWSPPSTEPCAK